MYCHTYRSAPYRIVYMVWQIANCESWIYYSKNTRNIQMKRQSKYAQPPRKMLNDCEEARKEEKKKEANSRLAYSHT